MDTMRTFLRGRTPAAQLEELVAEIAARQAERTEAAERLPRETLAAMTGDTDAAQRRDMTRRQIAELDERLAELQTAAVAARQRIAADAAAELQREAEARPRRVAELRRERLALVGQATEDMRRAAAAITAVAKNSEALMTVLDDDGARNFLAAHAFRTRAQGAFARAFAIDPAGQLTPRNNLLGFSSGFIGQKAHWTIEEHELEGMDNLCPYFDNHADAVAAQDRLAAQGTKTLVTALPGDCWAVVPVEYAYGDHATASAAADRLAARGKRFAIVPHGGGGGFVLLPERFAGGDRVMALDATQQARVDAINERLRDKAFIPAFERKALLDELNAIIAGPTTTRSIDRETQREINRLVQQPAYLDRSHIDHQQIVEDVTALYARAAGQSGGSSDGANSTANNTTSGEG
jgi:hypothetical protein